MVLAEKLGMTLRDLRRRIGLDELRLWGAFYKLREDQEKEEQKKSERQSARRGWR